MTIQEHDKHCTALFRKLDALKASGQGGAIAGEEYMATLRELQTATRERLGAAGLTAPLLANEQEALALSNDRKRLLKRMRETVSVLRKDRYAKFFQGKDQRFDFNAKRLYGACGFYLQWKLREHPEMPEGYENQQTSVGTVYLERLTDV